MDINSSLSSSLLSSKESTSAPSSTSVSASAAISVSSTLTSPPASPFSPRVVLISSAVQSPEVLYTAVRSEEGILAILYEFRTTTFDTLLHALKEKLNGMRARSIALLNHGEPGLLYVCATQIVSRTTLLSEKSVKQFWLDLGSFLDKTSLSSASPNILNARIDILGNDVATIADGRELLLSLEALVGVPFLACTGLTTNEVVTTPLLPAEMLLRSLTVGADLNVGGDVPCIGAMYFRLDKLKGYNVDDEEAPNLGQFEKIRIVGKGAFGKAVFYRKTEDDSLVVLKEVNLHEMKAAERAMALNEASVLSILDHPNIVTYYDSFEENGVLNIEMEYCDGGTLDDFLKKCIVEIEECELLTMYRQMADALQYIHANHILHRDLKTSNIFLTKSGIVKLGDFGIAKVLSETFASSVVGTPYYISPELCEGKPYNEKNDVWSLGCIFYEMANLSKTFDGTNLPALVNKIMSGSFAPIKATYSAELRGLIQDMLRQNPNERLSMNEVLARPIMTRVASPQHLNNLTEAGSVNALNSNVDEDSIIKSYIYSWGMLQLLPALVESSLSDRTRMRSVAVGQNHIVAVSWDGFVYAWGDGSRGQLGIGLNESSLTPRPVDTLLGKNVSMVSCGNEFSAFITTNGLLLTCGSGEHGCLGHGCCSDVFKPRFVESLISQEVTSVSCGFSHVVAIVASDEIYSWGLGHFGQLGLGNDVSFMVPQKVLNLSGDVIRQAACGVDATMFLTDKGRVLACGSNLENKLGLNARFGFLMQRRNNRLFNRAVDFVLSPQPVKILSKYHVIAVSLGISHSAVLTASGKAITLGSNQCGQLGDGSTKQHEGPVVVKGLPSCKRICCGDQFTVAATIHTTEDGRGERIFTWGNGVDGSLGTGETNIQPTPTALDKSLINLNVDSIDGATGAGVPITELPLPVVQDIACSKYMVVVLAETHNRKITATKRKRINPRVRDMTVDDSLNNGNGDNSIDRNASFKEKINNTSCLSSPRSSRNHQNIISKLNDVPAWLKEEMDDAEHIPISPDTSRSVAPTTNVISRTSSRLIDSAVMSHDDSNASNGDSVEQSALSTTSSSICSFASALQPAQPQSISPFRLARTHEQKEELLLATPDISVVEKAQYCENDLEAFNSLPNKVVKPSTSTHSTNKRSRKLKGKPHSSDAEVNSSLQQSLSAASTTIPPIISEKPRQNNIFCSSSAPEVQKQYNRLHPVHETSHSNLSTSQSEKEARLTAEIIMLREAKDRRQQELLRIHAEKMRWAESAYEDTERMLQEKLSVLEDTIAAQVCEIDLNAKIINVLQSRLAAHEEAAVAKATKKSNICSLV